MAIQKIKAIKYGAPGTEEDKVPGCPFYIMHQLSNYCFFQYMEKYGENKELSEEEIAAYLLMTPEEVATILAEVLDDLSYDRVLETFTSKK
jgi:hypothetical protein